MHYCIVTAIFPDNIIYLLIYLFNNVFNTLCYRLRRRQLTDIDLIVFRLTAGPLIDDYDDDDDDDDDDDIELYITNIQAHSS